MDNDANKLLNDLFNKAKNEPSKVSFEETKERFLTSVGTKNNATKGNDFARFFNLKLIIMIASIITTVALVLVLKPTNTTKTVEKITTTPSTPATLVVANEKQVLQEQQQVITEYLRKVDKLTPQRIELKQEKEQNLLIPADSLKKYQEALVQSARITELLDTGYKFPKLTPEEILANNKQKAKMIKQLDKLDKKHYAFIPTGTFKADDKNWSVQAFYMQTTEVTNLEYRTFLFDLLIHERKDEFLAAKPDQSRWVKDYSYSYNKPMEEQYFSHAAYNDYPVVAISRKGAEMYCKWLTEEVNKQRNGTFINDVRLPSNYEWMYAAAGGKDGQSYPWGGPYLKNAKGCYLANYQPLKGNFKDDGAFHTAKVDSYYANDYGLYCMSGNVAEMVYYENENQLPGTKGGSWTSVAAEIQINGADKYKGMSNASVDIGFRPVITYFNKMINPTGTVKINDQLYMDETEITNFNWQEYVMWLANKHGKTAIEYKNALPDTLVWRDKLAYNEPYTKYYYSHPAYKEFPVIGISYEQAVQYCKWRTERVKELFKTKQLTDKKNVYPSNFEYRLPTKEEWEAAAKIGYSEKTKKLLETKHKGQLLANLRRKLEDNVVVAGNPTQNADVTAPVKSYWPNAAGCYNLIGNVAEMINQQGLAKGGSWISNPNEIDIERDITYTKPTAWLGFRCVAEIKSK
ncbi:MAG: SUMF1/EgtB/PvdO family nonheme iron enzyme [Flavobacteriales bacterium]|nr:SUMF1/EgtB/PvdO family nonheme iron enzyme [Flavobacteriales bacterium]